MLNYRYLADDGDDLFRLRAFYERNWSGSHIYWSGGEAYFRWIHCRTESVVDFFVAEERDSGLIRAAVGCIDSAKFGGEVCTGAPIWLILLRVEPSASLGLTILLLRELIKCCPERVLATVGATQEAQQIYSALGFDTGSLHHYGWINPHSSAAYAERVRAISNLDAAAIDSSVFRDLQFESSAEVCSSWTLCVDSYKSVSYLDSWYGGNPARTYSFLFGSSLRSNKQALLVFREVNIDGLRLFRVVDILGDETVAFAVASGYCLQKDYDCFDVYTLRDPGHECLKAIGVRKIGANNFFSHYLSPVVRKEIPLRYAVLGRLDFDISRGDCDQDRPSADIFSRGCSK